MKQSVAIIVFLVLLPANAVSYATGYDPKWLMRINTKLGNVFWDDRT